ncbi:hypothetical protein E3N88_22332 [Mikania micrantha]|uniref:Uncharacterized protein n=1 Tax=Mikania micrantha TaxID=192012 RepID=A0A5N6NA65_9ASTR|nr:hypothetical protein E3N88_22332 [Mikania micrantha]
MTRNKTNSQFEPTQHGFEQGARVFIDPTNLETGIHYQVFTASTFSKSGIDFLETHEEEATDILIHGINDSFGTWVQSKPDTASRGELFTVLDMAPKPSSMGSPVARSGLYRPIIQRRNTHHQIRAVLGHGYKRCICHMLTKVRMDCSFLHNLKKSQEDPIRNWPLDIFMGIYGKYTKLTKIFACICYCLKPFITIESSA